MMNYKKEIKRRRIMVILGIILLYGISFLITAGLFWILIQILTCIGITAIGGLVLVFSWKLAFYFWLICCIIKLIFANPSLSK